MSNISELIEKVKDVLEADRYNPEAIEILEQSVQEQVTRNTYNSDANFSLLKLYQFSPQQRNNDICFKILAKALFHKDDFMACFYFLPSSMQSMEPFETLHRLSKDLESASFAEFWNRIKTVELFNDIKGFKNSARIEIAKILALSYQQIPMPVVAKFLDYTVSSAELGSFLLEQNWVLDKDVVLIPSNTQNKPRAKKFEESIQLHQVAPLFRFLET